MNAFREEFQDARFDGLDARIDRLDAKFQSKLDRFEAARFESKLATLCTRRFSLLLTLISTTVNIGAIFLAAHFRGTH